MIKEGYVYTGIKNLSSSNNFLGGSTAYQNSMKIESSSIVRDYHLIVVFEEKVFTIKYDLSNNSDKDYSLSSTNIRANEQFYAPVISRKKQNNYNINSYIVFNGWERLLPNGQYEDINDGLYTYNQDITIRPKWEFKDYNVVLDLDGGIISEKDINDYNNDTYNQEQKIKIIKDENKYILQGNFYSQFKTIPLPNKKGYKFLHYKISNRQKDAKNKESLIIGYYGVNYYAIYQPVEIDLILKDPFNVVTESDDKIYKTLKVSYESFYQLPVFNLESHTFLGWYTTEQPTQHTHPTENDVKIEPSVSKFEQNQTLYAWFIVNRVQVYIYGNGGKNPVSGQNLDQYYFFYYNTIIQNPQEQYKNKQTDQDLAYSINGDKARLPIPKKPGYTFENYYYTTNNTVINTDIDVTKKFSGSSNNYRSLKVLYSPISYTNAMYSNLYDFNTDRKLPNSKINDVMQFDRKYNITIPQRKGYYFKGFKIYKQKANDGSYDTDNASYLGKIEQNENTLFYNYPYEITLEAQWEKIDFKVYFSHPTLYYNDEESIKVEQPEGFIKDENTTSYYKYYTTFDVDNNVTIKLPKDYKGYYFDYYTTSINSEKIKKEFTIGFKDDADIKILNNSNNTIYLYPNYEKQVLNFELWNTKTNKYTSFTKKLGESIGLNYNIWQKYTLEKTEDGYPGEGHHNEYVHYGWYNVDFETFNVWNEDENNWGEKYTGDISLPKDKFPEIDPSKRNERIAATLKYYRRGKRYDQNKYREFNIYEHDMEEKQTQKRVFNYFPNEYKNFNIQKDYLNLYASNLKIDSYKIGNTLEQAQGSNKIKNNTIQTIDIDENINHLLLYQKEPEYNIYYVNPKDVDEEELVYTMPEENTTNQNVPYKTPTSFIRNVSFYIPIPKHKNDSYVFSYWEYTYDEKQENFRSLSYEYNQTLKLNLFHSIKLRPVFSPKIYNYTRMYKYPNGKLEYTDTDAYERTIKYGDKFTKSHISNNGRKGYTQNHYYVYKKDYTPISQDSEIHLDETKFLYNEDVIIIIQLEPKTYKFLYELDGSSYIDEKNPENNITQENNEKDYIYDRYFKIDKFSKKGYIFSSFRFNGYLIPNIDSKFDLNYNVTLLEAPQVNLITLIFTPINYYIEYDHPFNEQNGNSYSKNPTKYIASGSDIPLARPIRIGYTFLGWTSSDNPNADPVVDYKIDTTNPKNLILKSHWKAHTYEIRFLDAQVLDPTDSTNTKYVDRMTVNYNESLIKPIPKERKGYRFVSWNRLTNDVISFPFLVTADKTRNIWQARWAPISYEIKADYNGGNVVYGESSIPQNFEAGSFIILPRLYKQYHIFKGWKNKLNQEDPKLSYIIDSKINHNVDVEAVFEPEEYSLKINLNNSKFDQEEFNNKKTLQFKYGDVIEELFENNLSPKKENHIFTGWKINGQTIAFPLSILSNYYNGKVIIANFEPINYSINYQLNGSLTDVGPDSYQKGEIIEIKSPEKAGYKFSHWILKQADDRVISDRLESYTITESTPGSIKLEAIFEPIKYKIYVDYQIPEIPNQILEYTYLYKKEDNSPLVEIKERNGYRFLGYYDTKLNVFNNKQYNYINDIFLQAKWEKLNYNITFINKVEGKVEEKTTTIHPYDELYSQPIVNEEGYKIAYFFKYNKDFTEGEKIEKFPFPVTQDLNIGVKYDLLTYNIYYDVRDGINNPLNKDKIFTINDRIDIYPANKFGYTFNGWTIRLASETQDKPIYGGFDGSLYKADVIITAHWVDLKLKVEFETNSQDIIPSIEIQYNTYVSRPKDPYSEGKKFMYWYKDSIYKPFDFNNEKISQDTVLYARYIPIIYITNIVHDEYRTNALIIEFSKFIDELTIEQPYSYLARLNLYKFINISNGAIPLSITPIDYNKLELLFRPSDLTSNLYITFNKGMPLLKDKIQSTSDIAILAEDYKVNFYIDRFTKTVYANDVEFEKVDIENNTYLLLTIKDANSTTTPVISISNDDTFELVLVGLVKTLNQYRYKIFIEKGKTIQEPTDITINIKLQGENKVISKNFIYTVIPNEIK